MGVEEGPTSVEGPWLYYWGDWVLANGLPDLPASLGEDEAVPVAYWRGERWAAVLELRHRCALVGFEPEGLDTDVQGYRWSGRDWEAAGATGGGSWSDDLHIQAPDLQPDEVTCLGHGWHGGPEWVVGDAYGVAGSEAGSVEVEQEGRVLSRPIASPLRAWVVAFDGRLPAVVRVRSHRAVLFQDVGEPAGW